MDSGMIRGTGMGTSSTARQGSRPVIGLALGSGAARGWAHVGVLRALEEIGVRPDIVCGTSVGALVGAAWLTDQLDELQAWVGGMGVLGVLKLVDLTLARGGLVAIEKVFERFRNPRTDLRIETLPVPFAAVATDLATGREVWLRDGHLLDVVRASAAMPGLFPPVQHEGRWLVDGALVNPVPVSLCRALGAEVVIAVNLNSDLSALPRLARGPADAAALAGQGPAVRVRPADATPPDTVTAAHPLAEFLGKIGAGIGERTRQLAAQLKGEREPSPSMLETMAGSIDIMQDRITRSRLAGDPPEVLIAPRIGQIGILDFDRGEELMRIGHATAMALRPAIEQATEKLPG
jgi:NTE family protein